MAKRPIFIPNSKSIGVIDKQVEFKWFSGFAISQKQKSVNSLHDAARQCEVKSPLEISSKSQIELGVKLSAFNLLITTKKMRSQFTVESAFQGSKVFEFGGPYQDLFGLDSRKAKKDLRLKESGKLVAFKFFGSDFPLIPRTYFYDWLYINALAQNSDLAAAVVEFDGFTDIEFNPQKSLNCQAHAVALFVSLSKNGILTDSLCDPVIFMLHTREYYQTKSPNENMQSLLI